MMSIFHPLVVLVTLMIYFGSIANFCEARRITPAQRQEESIAKEAEPIVEYGLYSDDYLRDLYRSGLRRVTQNAKTEHCKGYIEFEFMKLIRSHADETPAPFEDIFFHSQCDELWTKHPPLMPVFMKAVPPRPELPPPPPRSEGPLDPEKLAIMYVLLTHNTPNFSMRLIDSLNEPQHTFIIHVDMKSPESQRIMEEYAKDKDNVFVMDRYRHGLNWGGYTIVNATLGAMMYGWETGRHFDYLIDLSGTHYPIKSNKAIRKALSVNAAAIYMDVIPDPVRPPSELWHHYVECDDALHRIGRMAVLRGMNMYLGSQWFAVPRHVVQWYLEDPLPYDYSFYAQHIIVADENYFTTLTRNSPYCLDLQNKNLLFVLFDKWENERHNTTETRDARKCLNPDPDTCGRSPTTLTMEFKQLLRISKALFARKFDPDNKSSMELADLVDTWRAKEDFAEDSGDEGQQFMIRAKVGVGSTRQTELCWEMQPNDDSILMNKCDPARPKQWFTIGPCIDATNFSIPDGQCPRHAPGDEDALCQIQSSPNTCLDIAGQNPEPGGPIIGYECLGQWNQLFKFGSDCTVSAVLPEAIGRVRGYENQNVTLCMEQKVINSRTQIITGKCAYSPGTAISLENVTASNASAVGLSTSILDPNSSESASKYSKELLRKKQTFEFIRRDGELHKALIEAVNKRNAAKAAGVANAGPLAGAAGLAAATNTVAQSTVLGTEAFHPANAKTDNTRADAVLSTNETVDAEIGIAGDSQQT